MSRFKAIGHFVYEKGDRIGVTLDEAAVELTQKLNAYQMRVERLKAEVERLTNNCDYLDRKLDEELDKSAMLCGQVERLTKAGDAMAIALNLNDDVFDNHEKKLAQSAWNAAKEGKQS